MYVERYSIPLSDGLQYNNVWKIIPVLRQVVQQSFLQMLSKSLVSLLPIAIPFFITMSDTDIGFDVEGNP